MFIVADLVSLTTKYHKSEIIAFYQLINFYLSLLLMCFIFTKLIITFFYYTWASTRQNLSLGFPTKRDSNQSPQLQRLARKSKFRL